MRLSGRPNNLQMKIESHSGWARGREQSPRNLRLTPCRCVEDRWISWVILCFMLCLISSHSFAQTPKENQDTSLAQDTQPDKLSNWNWSFSIRNRTGFRTDEPRVFQMSRTIFETK